MSNEYLKFDPHSETWLLVKEKINEIKQGLTNEIVNSNLAHEETVKRRGGIRALESLLNEFKKHEN